jgi:hypothetical protein
VAAAADGAVRGAFDLVVRLRPERGGHGEAVTDLDALDGLDAHQRSRQARVQPTVPVHVAAQPRRDVVGHHLDDAAQRVPGPAGAVDQLDHGLGGRGVKAAHLGLVDEG